MLWSNEALKYEDKWYDAVKSVLKELALEVIDNLEKLEVDDNGVLMEVPKQDILFDKNKAVTKMVDATKDLTRETLQYFGDRAIKEEINGKS